ncbi:MAG: polysaccharide biosynthesis tyrosine autokinase [Acidimicrobiia bacterium]|nr:polysaccharide biosynthesis tyrosine autokinase [Acidimicrobiia bacterium]
MPLEDEPGPELRDYLAVLRRRKWTILLCLVVVVGASLINSFLQTPIYQGRATVLLQPRSTDALFNSSTGARNDPARAVETEIQVLKSEPVRAVVREKLGVAPPVSASAVGETDVINVTATSTKPADAAKIANAYADSYIEFRRDQAIADLQAASTEIQNRVADLQKQIDEIDSQVNALPPGTDQTAKRASLAPQKDQLILQQGTFKERLGQLQVDVGLTTGRAQMVTPAVAPTDPIKPTPLRSGILALVVGLVLGMALAFLRDHLDDSIKTKDDLDRAGGGLPVIGVIPAVADWKAKDAPRVVSLADSRSAATEAYRTLRTSIQFLTLDRPLRVLQITSPSAQEGKSTTISNLAVALAGMGQRVVIVCCDLRRPRIHEFFGLDNSIGLTSVLLGQEPLTVALQDVPDQPRLSLLASGPLPPNPADLLSSQRTAEVLAALQAHADIVLIDSPPVLPVTDSLILSGRVDATLLTCLAGVTTRREFSRASELLRHVGAPLVGTVLNGASEGEPYGYYYRYYSPKGGNAKGGSPKGKGGSPKGGTPTSDDSLDSSSSPSAKANGNGHGPSRRRPKVPRNRV